MIAFFYIGADGNGHVSSEDKPIKKEPEKEIPPDFKGAPAIIRLMAKIQIGLEQRRKK